MQFDSFIQKNLIKLSKVEYQNDEKRDPNSNCYVFKVQTDAHLSSKERHLVFVVKKLQD